ncbi:MAG: hypothetical protein ACK47B_23585 [Armatimonadota bacterium]
MTKTDRMLLLEARAGRDIREILRDAYAAGGGVQRGAEWIEEQYGVSISFALFSDWIEALGGEIQRELVFPGLDADAGIESDPTPIEALP